MKQRLLIIYNPRAGVRKANSFEEIVHQNIDKEIFEYEVIPTQYPKHASELSQKALNEGYDILAVAGGDGTLNEVASSMVNSDISLAIIPCGSGNGLARHLGIPMDIVKAIQLINKKKTIKIDTVSVNDQVFLNVAGLGFDAYISNLFNETKTRGFFNYIKLCFTEWIKYKTKEYEIRYDDQVIIEKAFIICFANSCQYGNNAIIAPKADIQDGMIEMCIIKKPPFWTMPLTIQRLFRKKIGKSSFCKCITLKKVKIINKELSPVHLDGEPKETNEILSIETNPFSLNVIVP